MLKKDLTMAKDFWKIDKLRNWEQNPRSIKDKDFKRLKDQIIKLGQYKPILITPDGEVIGKRYDNFVNNSKKTA